MTSNNPVPTGKIRRSGLIGMTTAKAGIKKMQFVARKPFLSQQEKDIHAGLNDQEIAKLIFIGLGQLKGTVLKLAQMLSMELELIPLEYRKELEKAASNVPPINRALIRKIISTQLGDPPEKIFSSFEPSPFAAASLGQVHRAISYNGEELAVKVQYPGIAESVKSDLDILKLLLKSNRHTRSFSKCSDEIKTRITEELDYLKEAENISFFRKNLDMDGVIIPEVFPDLTTSKVLTMSMVHGQHLNQWLDTAPSQDKKDHYGQMLVDLFKQTLFEKNILHADPNPGNYLFREDGKLGLIDFGCIKRVTRDFAMSIKHGTDLYGDMSPGMLDQFYDTMGFTFNRDFNDKEFRDFLAVWIEWVTRPQRNVCFDFSNNDDYMSDGIMLFRRFHDFLDRVDGEFTFFGRSFNGLMRLLQKIGAKVDMRF